MSRRVSAHLGKIALIFPGQGSQEVGMGRDLAEAHPEARRLYDQSDEILAGMDEWIH